MRSLSVFPLPIRFLSIASLPVPATQPLLLPFPSSCFRLAVASAVLRFFLSASPFSTFSSAWFPMLLFRFPVLGFLFVSFRPPLIRSHSRSSGAYLLLSPSATSLPIRFLSFASLPGLDYSASVSFRSASSRLLPHSGYFRCSASAFASSVFPVPSGPVSRAFFPGSSYLAFCSFPFALP